jgi:thiamine biosynthesis lipoprotein
MSRQRKTTRREFLKGRSAVEAWDYLAREIGQPDETTPDCPPTGAPGRTDRRAFLVQIGRSAMSCQFEIFLNAGQHPGAEEVAIEALDLVDELEDQMSVYRDHSEVSRINRRAGSEPVPVEPRLFELLRCAVDLHDQSQGAFDITAGPLSKVWGFYRRQGRMPSRADLRDALRRVDSGWLQLDAEDHTIQFGTPTMEINLGGIGKGYALDRCAELLRQRGVEDFLLHGGQSSVLAGGSCAGSDDDQPGWIVSVRHPLRPGRRLAEIRLADCAVGTSGSGRQRFHYKGRRYGHILDPRTGKPAEGVLSSSVIAPSAATADALATAFYVMGPDKALEHCAAHEELGAVLVCPGKRAGAIEVHAAGLDDSQWRLLDQ